MGSCRVYIFIYREHTKSSQVTVTISLHIIIHFTVLSNLIVYPEGGYHACVKIEDEMWLLAYSVYIPVFCMHNLLYTPSF